MADFSIISDVSNEVLKLLRENICPELIQSPESIALAAPTDKNADFQLGLYLYDIQELREYQNLDMIRLRGNQAQYPPKPLNLFFALYMNTKSQMMSNVENEQRILGRAMQVLMDHAILYETAENDETSASITLEALGNTQRRIETARAYYLAEHQDEPVGKIQNVAVTTLEKFRSGVRKRRNLAPRSLPENDVRFIDPQYNELFRVPDGGVVQMTYPDGHQRSEVVEYLDDYHMKIGSSVQHICEFAERMARSHAIVEPEPLTQQDSRAWNLEYDYYLTVQANGGAWEYALYQGDCCLLERGKIDAPELMIEEVRDEILYSHNLWNKGCIPLTQEELAQKLADRNEIQSYRMKQFQQSGHDCYLVMQLHQDCLLYTSRCV